jgi:hypothetical protein
MSLTSLIKSHTVRQSGELGQVVELVHHLLLGQGAFLDSFIFCSGITTIAGSMSFKAALLSPRFNVVPASVFLSSATDGAGVLVAGVSSTTGLVG